MRYDAADKSAASALFKNIGDTFGAPDIVVCNAGITADTLLIRDERRGLGACNTDQPIRRFSFGSALPWPR